MAGHFSWNVQLVASWRDPGINFCTRWLHPSTPAGDNVHVLWRCNGGAGTRFCGADYISRDLLRLSPGSLAALWARICTAFVLSGVALYLAVSVALGPPGRSGSLIFFGIQPAAIALETFVAALSRHADAALPPAVTVALPRPVAGRSDTCGCSGSADPGGGDGVTGGCQSDYGGSAGELESTGGRNGILVFGQSVQAFARFVAYHGLL
ncbi:hypothetical protein C8R44DRAFT_751987 [Mycena epipterygia]|nr:hypothetical protein C8R44DRAFT_751987 [Mycena epipterygia]